ncbi:hypothetical protein AgCh_033927 [Apium graveolens]
MYPLPTVHSPTPHPRMLSPFPYTDDDEEDGMDAQTYEDYDISSNDPDSPLPTLATIHVAVHDWIVAQLKAEITDTQGTSELLPQPQPAESVNQQRNEPDPVVNEESVEDLDYNEYDEEEYVEEEAEDSHQGGNPMNEFMELLRANLNQYFISPQLHAAQQTAATALRAFKSLKPPEFLGSADPVEARSWLKEMEKSFEILETDAVIPWDRFTLLFLDKYFPRFMDTQMEIKFVELKHDKMTMAEYEAKFTELS